jgi:membrane protease YdiL (CAAX protease family)
MVVLRQCVPGEVGRCFEGLVEVSKNVLLLYVLVAAFSLKALIKGGFGKELLGKPLAFKLSDYKDELLAFLFTYGLFVLLSIPICHWNLIDCSYTFQNKKTGMQEMLNVYQGGYSLVYMAHALILAPLAEELFFRGVLLFVVFRKWGTYYACLVSGLLFGFSHMFEQQGGVAPLVLDGIMLSWICLRSRNLWLTIFAHSVLNGIAVVQGIVMFYFLEGPYPTLFQLCIGLVAVLLGARPFARCWKQIRVTNIIPGPAVAGGAR